METIKKDKSLMKDTLTEMKNILQGLNGRMDDAKNYISNLKYKKGTNNQNIKKKKESKKMRTV